MRAGIDGTVTSEDRRRLEAVVRDRNPPQKPVWRARITPLTADELGTNGIIRATGMDKTVFWRWQERVLHEGVEGPLRDKTRPPGYTSSDESGQLGQFAKRRSVATGSWGIARWPGGCDRKGQEAQITTPFVP